MAGLIGRGMVRAYSSGTFSYMHCIQRQFDCWTAVNDSLILSSSVSQGGNLQRICDTSFRLVQFIYIFCPLALLDNIGHMFVHQCDSLRCSLDFGSSQD